jgi:hypothetical protein
MKPSTLTRANQHQLIEAVRKALCLSPTPISDWDEFAAHVDEYANTGLPFSLTSLRVIYERLPLYAEMLHDGRNSVMLDYLQEGAENDLFLFMDKMLSGADAPHIASLVSEDAEVVNTVFISGMKTPKMVFREFKDGSKVCLAPLKSFTRTHSFE